MKRTVKWVLAAALMGCSVFSALAAQEKAYSFRSETKLAFKSCLFEAAAKSEPGSKVANPPDILLLAKIFESGLSEKTADQLTGLKKYFRLPDLKLKEESPDVEMTWHIYEEYKESKDHKDEIKKGQEIRQTAVLNGDEYTVFLIPQEINSEDNVYKFLLEIYRAQNKEGSALVSTELVTKKEILWNFQGPLAVSFFFDDAVYVLTFTIHVSFSSNGGHLGSRLTWVI